MQYFNHCTKFSPLFRELNLDFIKLTIVKIVKITSLRRSQKSTAIDLSVVYDLKKQIKHYSR